MKITPNTTLNEIAGARGLLGNPTVLIIMGANKVTCRVVGLASVVAEAEDLADALDAAFHAYREAHRVLVGMGAVTSTNVSDKV
jgi:hypothetical protein